VNELSNGPDKVVAYNTWLTHAFMITDGADNCIAVCGRVRQRVTCICTDESKPDLAAQVKHLFTKRTPATLMS